MTASARKRIARPLAAFFACAAITLTAAPASAETARPADAFVESVGVNVHTTFRDTVYGRFTDWKAKLHEGGIRYVRDALVASDADEHTKLNALAAEGIRANLLMGDPKNKYGNGTLDQLITALKTKVPGAVVSVEGPNEWDASGNKTTWPTWATDLRNYQIALSNRINGDPALTSLPVIGPSFIYHADRTPVGDLSAYLDCGNVHSYPGGRPPDMDGSTGGTLTYEFTQSAVTAPGKPVCSTETGYHNALSTTSGHKPASERAAGIYTPRLYLEYFRRGIQRAFMYELIDQGTSTSNQESRFGLLRNDLSEKPSFRALKNLNALLSDPGTPLPAAGLDYTLSGSTSNVHRVLLHKRDGSFWLALWQNASVWNQDTRTELYPADQNVTLTLPSPAARADVYRPGSSTAPVATYADTASLSLRVPADVMLVRLSPGSAAPAPEPNTEPAPEPAPTPEPEPAPTGSNRKRPPRKQSPTQTTTTTTFTLAPATSVGRLPSKGGCVRGRRLTFRLRRPRRMGPMRIAVFVTGQRVTRLSRSRLPRTVRLRVPNRRVFSVKVVATARDGKSFRFSRRYRTCG